jgi:glycosyltransferase involved in cell wall biosynthesis
MVILLIHNFYQRPGGEDARVRQERNLLASHGHRIVEYTRQSKEITLNGLGSRIRLGAGALWSKRTYRELRSLLARERPDVAHVHNTVPLISPAAYYACQEAGVPVIQTLHNFRLLCASGYLLREGRICEECLEHTLFRGVWHRCYKDSVSASAAIALMLASQRALGTWKQRVDCYIACTEFARGKFIEGGLSAEKIVVKPCFVHPDPGLRTGPGETVLFVGRLSPEKGLRTLIAAWGHLGSRVPLRIAGDGPLRTALEVEIKQRGLVGVEMLGQLSGENILAEMKRARFLVFPSEWYEGLPLTLAEAFACGVPLVASRIGSMIELVQDGRTGLHFTPGDPEDLAAKIEWAWMRPEAMEEMGLNARAEFEENYLAERNYQTLMRINERVIQSRRNEAKASDRSIEPGRGTGG